MPLAAEHHEFVRWLERRPENLWTWRYGGQILSPEEHGRRLWAGVLAQFCVGDRASDELIGLVTLYNASLRDGTASLAALGRPDREDGMVAEAAVLLTSYAFTSWPLRKLYLDTISSTLAQFSSVTRFLGGALREEARFRDAVWVGGRYEDRVVLTVDRSDWDRNRDRIAALSVRPPVPAGSVMDIDELLPGVSTADDGASLAGMGADSLVLVELRVALEERGAPAEGLDLQSTVGDLRARLGVGG